MKIVSATRLVLMAVALMLLSACAPKNGHRALASGNLNLAEPQARQAALRGDSSGYNNLGAVEMRRGNRESAIKWFNIAARMGDATARMNLAQLGEKIPAADLAVQLAVSPSAELATDDIAVEVLAAGVTGYVQGRYSPRAQKPQKELSQTAPIAKPQPAPVIVPPSPRCYNQSVTEKGKVRYMQVCN